jgi:RNA polymerase sigma-70 factor, ECF subfamily
MSQSFAQRPPVSPKVWEFHPWATPRPYNLATDMDERAFTTAAEAYATRLYTVAYRMLGNRADAEDAVQRALLKCYAARTSYSPRWQVSTWLYRALANVCIDDLRRRRPRVEIGDDHAAPSDGHRAVERLDLEAALATVPREARMLLALYYVDGLSYGELARVRGISINTVKSQLARGKAILKRALANGGHRP